MDIKSLSSNDFDNKGNVINPLHKVTIVGFFMNGCGFCERLKPTYKMFAMECKKRGNASVCEVERTTNEELFERMKNEKKWQYEIEGFPMIIGFVNGKYKSVFDGNRELQELLLFVDSLSHNKYCNFKCDKNEYCYVDENGDCKCVPKDSIKNNNSVSYKFNDLTFVGSNEVINKLKCKINNITCDNDSYCVLDKTNENGICVKKSELDHLGDDKYEMNNIKYKLNGEKKSLFQLI